MSRHSEVQLTAHFVWGTEGRHPFIKPEWERRLYAYIAKVCQEAGCTVLAIGGLTEHVHLLVNMGHDVTIASLMHRVKGGSSRFLGKLAGEEESYFGWQRGYGVFGVSPHDRGRVMEYIRNQKKRHAKNLLWPNAECAFGQSAPAQSRKLAVNSGEESPE